MPKPYYQDDWVTLYHGDCLELADLWTCADVLITDPPYGIAWDRPETKGSKSSWYNPGIQGDGSTAVRDAALAARGDSRPGLVFGSIRAAWPDYRMVLVFRKPEATASGMFGAFLPWRKDWEPVFVVGSDWSKQPSTLSSVVSTNALSAGGYRGYATATGHPHTKPQDVMQQLIMACPPGVIADPFAGSGSTLVAAKALGRRAIGVELEERYAEIAARRLAQGGGVLMPDLIITPDVVERGARAMYTASLANAGPHRDTFDELPAYWRATLTTQARACLTEALHPTPTRPLDGQEPLIGET